MPLSMFHPVFLSLGPPNAEKARSAISHGKREGFNYPFVGKTESFPPLDASIGPNQWVIDRTRIEVGSGKETFDAARNLLNRWGQFQLGWTWVDASTPIKQGQAVCVNAGFLNIFACTPLEIAYVREGITTASAPTASSSSNSAVALSKRGSSNGKKVKTYAFAHGCLSGHLLAGEEKFTIEHDLETDKVTYEVLAVSRPAGVVGLLGYPIIRLLQMKFGQDSAAAVKKALSKPAENAKKK